MSTQGRIDCERPPPPSPIYILADPEHACQYQLHSTGRKEKENNAIKPNITADE